MTKKIQQQDRSAQPSPASHVMPLRYPNQTRRPKMQDSKMRGNPQRKPITLNQALAECPLNSNFNPLGSFFFSTFSFSFFVDLETLLPPAALLASLL